MNSRRGNSHARAGGSFFCRYVERTISQLGEEALELGLVARHLTSCPACRAQRRRVAKVDCALREALIGETPGWFDGRWEDLCMRLPELSRRPARRERESSLLVCAVAVLGLLLGAAWHADHRTDPVTTESPVAVAAGVTVTEVALNGGTGEVEVEHQVNEDGTVVLWVLPEGATRTNAGGLR